MSDIGILSSPGDQLFVFLFLGSPAMLAGAILGALVGYVIGRKYRRWRGLGLGALAGLVLGGVGFWIFATVWL